MRRSLSEPSTVAAQSGWTDEAFTMLEREHAGGLSTQQVVELFTGRGGPLSEATFRKYVQLGLLPRSVRVGRKGKHRGSQGLYPPTVVRQIESIRRLMAQGYTIQEIKQEFFFLASELDGLTRQLKHVLVGVERAVERRGAVERADEVITRAVVEAKALAEELITRLRAIETGLAMRARMARAAV